MSLLVRENLRYRTEDSQLFLGLYMGEGRIQGEWRDNREVRSQNLVVIIWQLMRVNPLHRTIRAVVYGSRFLPA